MAEKKILGRAVQKHDIESNWLLATNFIPMQGEIIVYDIDENYNYERLKIGDGVTNVNDLPFVDDAVKEYINTTSAPSADKLANPVTIDGVKFDGSTYITHYGVCNTASTTKTKVVSLSNFSLHTGSRVIVKFTNTNTVPDPSLNVNDTGAVVIVHNGVKLGANSLVANGVYEFVYNGSHWSLVGDLGTQVVDNLESTSAVDALSANQGKVLAERIIENEDGLANLNTLVGDTSVSEQISTVVSESIATKMDKEDPVGTGSFSLNRKADTSVGIYSFTSGLDNTASGNYSHAEGRGTTASGIDSHAEGFQTVASGEYSHAENYLTKATKRYSHAEGYSSEASGDFGAHAEGFYTKATGESSHAEGANTTASGKQSHAEGKYTTAASDYQHVQGKYNISDSENKYAHIIGNGSNIDNSITWSNAHTIDWSGNAWFAGDIRIGGTSYDDAVSLVPKMTTVTLSAANWTGDTNPWSQVVTMNGVTVNSKIDLQPAAVQVVELQDNDIALMAENDDGIVTVYALGSKPTVDYTMQALITEVAVV